MNLQNGNATLNFKIPECVVGQKLKFKSMIIDPTRTEPFVNDFTLTVKDEIISGGGKGKRTKPPEDNRGKDKQLPSGISMPNQILVKEVPSLGYKGWSEVPGGSAFDKYSALRIIHADTSGDGTDDQTTDSYDFYINIDNLYLNSEIKVCKNEPDIIRARFIYGLVLLGLAILNDHKQEINKKRKLDSENEEEPDAENEISVEDEVEKLTRAVAPVILPMIEELGALDVDDYELPSTAGESA